MHYNSFGYDLGINNQVVWRYSNFQLPFATSGPLPYETKLSTHVELIFLLISPFYWIWESARMLLILEAGFVCFSGIAVYLLAKKRKLHPLLNVSLVITYLSFYGVQNAMWFDVHSASFAAAFLMWFIYFLDSNKFKSAILLCILAITTKENIGLLTLLISFIYFIKRKDKLTSILMIISGAYLAFIYFIYFPHIVKQEYLYQNKNGLLSNLNPLSLSDTPEKRQTIYYSLGSFGFISVLAPMFLLPAFGDFATYFILANDNPATHGLFMHYRITLAPLLVWATIMTIYRFKKLNNKYIALYIFCCALFFQYYLHLPLSYLSKSWFWTEPAGVKNITYIRNQLSPTDSIVAQNNIVPHISRRDQIYTLYPEKKKFKVNSPCEAPECDWFRWDGVPEYLFIDTSSGWDARHLLTDRDKFINGLSNMEKAGVIKKYKQKDSAVLYKINY